VIRPGYLDSHWTKAPWTTRGARGKAGATHLPLPSLPHAFLNAVLPPERLAEGGKPIPVMLAILAPQAPVSSAQINRHCIPAASRARKQHQCQNGGYGARAHRPPGQIRSRCGRLRAAAPGVLRIDPGGQCRHDRHHRVIVNVAAGFPLISARPIH
jgi:hypothetical protein